MGSSFMASTSHFPGFWSVIEKVKSDDGDRAHAVRLARALQAFPETSIVEFAGQFQLLEEDADMPGLWAASCLIRGVPSTDDSFLYFRRWLISRGQEVYDAALEPPDSLAKQAAIFRRSKVPVEFERFGYAAMVAYKVMRAWPL
jgi:hypothetical protein